MLVVPCTADFLVCFCFWLRPTCRHGTQRRTDRQTVCNT